LRSSSGNGNNDDSDDCIDGQGSTCSSENGRPIPGWRPKSQDADERDSGSEAGSTNEQKSDKPEGINEQGSGATCG